MNKKRFLLVTFLMCILTSAFATDGKSLADLADDTVVVEVGKYGVTAYELKTYMAGYKSIKNWNKENVLSVLNTMVLDLLFVNACLDEEITVKNSEVLYYTEYYFQKIGIDINDEERVGFYFESTDPYYDMEDFLNKATVHLLKTKYFAKKGFIKTTHVAHIFLKTENKSPAEKRLVQNRAMQAFYDVQDGEVPFTSLFTRMSEDNTTKGKFGDIGNCSANEKNEYIPKKKVKEVLRAGLFAPVMVENQKGYSIIMNTSYQLPDGKSSDKVIKKLFKKYPPKYFLTF